MLIRSSRPHRRPPVHHRCHYFVTYVLNIPHASPGTCCQPRGYGGTTRHWSVNALCSTTIPAYRPASPNALSLYSFEQMLDGSRLSLRLEMLTFNHLREVLFHHNAIPGLKPGVN
jgi:hypothetical protein